MSHVKLQTATTAQPEAQRLLAQIEEVFGMTPNMFRAVANAPAALKSMWSSFGALGGGTIGTLLGEKIAVAVADANDCHYCLAAHTALGQKAGGSAHDMAEAQQGRSSDPKTAAALTFVGKIVATRAQIETDDIAAMRAAGFDDEAIVEIVAHVALNLFTNYINVALAVPLDFPKVALARTA